MSRIVALGEAVSEYIAPLNDTRLVSLVAGFKTFTRANDEIRQLTGIRNFFDDAKTFDEFQTLLRTPARKTGAHQTREWGDFQTPPDLAMRVCQYLADSGVAPQAIVFTDAKRPYTKEALMRIDLAQAAAWLSLKNLRGLWRAMNFEPQEEITQTDIAEYCSILESHLLNL